MFEYFYNEVFRSVIIGFGSLFNGIEVRHRNDQDEIWSVIQVPLAYGPTQKFLARMQQEADLNRPIQVTLPRMSFEFTNLEYDPTRKVTQNQVIVVETPEGKVKKTFVPVPYNMTIKLSIMTKLNDDMLQIVEQILPYFQPAYSLPIKFLGNLQEVKYIPVNLDTIQMEDDYEGNFDTRRALVYTLSFTAKTYVYGPVADVTKDIITKVSVGYIAGTKGSKGAERDLTYQVGPRALKDYTNDQTTQLAENVDLTETVIDVQDASNIPAETYITVNKEEMFVKSKTGNKLLVRRGEDGTSVAEHLLGTPVNKITKEDNLLVEVGDDFGFDGNVF
jgi:hypothetical protein